MKSNYRNVFNPKTILKFIIALLVICTFNLSKASGNSFDKRKIAGPCPFNISFTVTQLTCFGNSNGQAIASVSGGVSPYTYSWEPNSETSDTATGLSAGQYTLTVTDSSGCVTIDSTIISQPGQFSFTFSVNNASCFGSANGQISAMVTGGTLPYVYSWSPNGDTSDTISGLSAGIYTLTVTDSNGCTALDSVNVNQPEPITITFTINNVSCFGGSNGQAIALVIGGTSPYKYIWSQSNNTSDTASGLGAGTYTLIVNDSNGCMDTSTVNISQPVGLSVTFSVTNASCFGNANGQVIATVNGGVTPYNYNWLPGGETSDTATGLSAGTYTLTVTDSNGCTLVDSVNITQPAQIMVAFSVTPATCGSSNGQAIATITNGVSPFTFLWSPGGETSDTATGLTGGSYTISVTDSTGCIVTASINVTQNPDMSLSLSMVTPISCFGGSNGQATALVSGGFPPFAFNWSPSGGYSDTANQLSAGTYTLTVTDSIGCTDTASIVVSQPAQIVVAFSVTPTACGSSNGQAIANISNGYPPFTFSWSPSGETSDTATGLSAGTYSLTVTDSNGCISTATVNINQKSNMVITFSVTNVSCFDGSNGQAIASVSNASPPYMYDWLPNGEISDTATGLSAGTYTLIVEDSLGCMDTSTVNVSQPAQIMVEFAVTNPSCYGNNNGQIIAAISNGVPPFTFSWSPGGQTSDTVTGISAGTYTLTVTDSTGCSSIEPVNVSQPAQLMVAYSVTPASCGSSNGQVIAMVSNGVPPLTYFWSPGRETSDTATGLSGGTYTLSVNDSSGCNITSTVNVTQASNIVVTYSVTPASCGSSNGQVIANVSSGTPPYTFKWSPGGETSDTASGLSFGTYTVTINDSLGCSSTATVNVPQASHIVISFTDVGNILCNGGSTGRAMAAASGGNSPYTFSWANGVTTALDTSLIAGGNTLTVTDSLGCFSTASLVLTQPSILRERFVVIPVTCPGDSNGCAYSFGVGGVSPYSFVWSNGSTSTKICDLKSVNISNIVTDANGCRDTVIIHIPQPLQYTIRFTSVKPVSCNGNADGEISVFVSNGTMPYTYLWTPGKLTSDTATGLSAGTYTLTVSNANGCSASASISVNQPPLLGIDITSWKNILCRGENTGWARVVATGGSSPYTYSWSNGETLDMDTELVAGSYSIIVTDNHGCSRTSGITLTQPRTVLTLSAATVSNVTCRGDSNGCASVIYAGGVGPYRFLWTEGDTLPQVCNLKANPTKVIVTDANGCVASASVTITEPVLRLEATVTHDNVICHGQSDGSAEVTAFGGTMPYRYHWDIGATTTQISNLSAGTYFCTITDTNNCTVRISVSIIETDLYSIKTSSKGVSCFGGDNGTARVITESGKPPFKYLWSNGQTGNEATGLTGGYYTVTVTDNLGCTASATVTVATPGAPLFIAVGDTETTNPTCAGDSNGCAFVMVSGGAIPYTYQWANGATINYSCGLKAGTYKSVVIDNHGCVISVKITLTEPTRVTATVTQTNIKCNGNNDGTASVIVKGGTLPYTYKWANGGTGTSVTNLGPGAQGCTITDAHGCGVNVAVNITQPKILTAEAEVTKNVSCFGGANGRITTNASNGGTEPYKYAWTNGVTTLNATTLSAGTYTIVITDHNGCNSSVSETVTQPPLLRDSVSAQSCPQNKGSVTIGFKGGTLPYTFLWIPGGIPKYWATGLSNGTYTVTVTDKNDCSATTTVLVACTGEELHSGSGDDGQCCNTVSDMNNIKLYPNPTRGQFTLQGVDAGSLIELYNVMGQKLESESNGKSDNMQIDISTYPAGIYLIRIINPETQNVVMMRVIKE